MVSLALRRYKFSAFGATVVRVPVSLRYSSNAKGPPGNGNDTNNNGGGSGEDASDNVSKTDQRRTFQREEHPFPKGIVQSTSTSNEGEESSSFFHRSQEQRFRRPRRFATKPKKSFRMASPYKQYYGESSPPIKDLRLVKDSAQFPILIPGQDIVAEPSPESPQNTVNANSSSNNNNNTSKSNHTRRRRRMLPTVNASALLDSPSYCRNSAFTAFAASKKSGESSSDNDDTPGFANIGSSRTEVAKRLLRGKKDLLNMLRGDIILQENSRPFCLAGHGVPKQLLQDHINMGDSILHHFNEPAEVSLRNSESTYPEAMKIREHNGRSHMWVWPNEKTTSSSLLPQEERVTQRGDGKNAGDRHQDVSLSWGERLNLYIAVMDRLVSKLGLVGPCFNKESRKYWSVKVYRGMAFPVEVISGTDVDGPVPVLEWNPLNRLSRRQPHVSVRLQGTPDLIPGAKDRSFNPVTLVYDARFQEEPRLEPATS